MRPLSFPVRELATYINDHYPDITAKQIQSLHINSLLIEHAALSLYNCSDNKHRYHILRALQRNTGNINGLINLRSTSVEPELKISKKRISMFEKIADIIEKNKISKLSLFESYYDQKLIYGKLCNLLCIKNSLRNRKKLSSIWRRNFGKFYCTSLASEKKSRVQTEDPIGDLFYKYDSLMDTEPEDVSPIEEDEQKKCIEETTLTNMDGEHETDDQSTRSFAILNKRNSSISPSISPILFSSDFEENLNKRQTAKISSDFEEIPEAALNLRNKKQMSDEWQVLPEGAINMADKSWKRPGFDNCNFREGEFVLTPSEFKVICQNYKLIPGQYAFIINEKIKSVNNTCRTICFKHSRYLKVLDYIKIYAYCQHECKTFVLEICNVSNEEEPHKVVVNSSSKNYNHLEKKTGQLRGLERKMIRNEIGHVKPIQQRQNDVYRLNPKSLLVGSLDAVKSDSVYRKVRSEKLALNDRSTDDLIDMILMKRDHQEFIQVVGTPLHVYIFSKEQVDIIKFIINDILYLDSTGTLIRQPEDKDKRVYYYAGVVQVPFNSRVCPVLEMVSSNHDTASIASWLLKFKAYYLNNSKTWPPFHIVVIDLSYAIMNAICVAWNTLELRDYLSMSFKCVTESSKIPDRIVQIHLCCVHIFKLMASEIDKHFSNKNNNRQMKEIAAASFNMHNWTTFCEWFKHFFIILNVKTKNNIFHVSYKRLLEICCQKDNTDISNSDDITTVITDDEINCSEALEKLSPFYTFFVNCESSYTTDSFFAESLELNDFCNVDFYKMFLKRYISILPLWSGLLLNNHTRVSNSPVERWFGILKKLLAHNLMHQKCSRIVRKVRKYVLFVHKEQSFKISKSKCHRSSAKSKEENKGLLSQEIWGKKKAKRPNNFKGNALKNILKNKNSALSLKTKYDVVDKSLCMYCKKGELDVTAEWVECDHCDGWVHQLCVQDAENRSFSGTFFCEFCIMEITEKDELVVSIPQTKPESKVSQKNISVICKDFLKDIILNENDRVHLESVTREQHLSPIWTEERKKRVTASHFGNICKARSDTALKNIAQNIIRPPNLSTVPAICHGIKNEQNAVRHYEKSTGVFCRPCGLTLHKEYQYLAGSPDGLVEDDGLIEIKCPFKIKDLDPEIASKNGLIEYCDRRTGKLKKNHKYYFQIQGLLEILDKKWCDFVIFTFKGMKIERIGKDASVWKIMFPKIKSFYMSYMLPYISGAIEEVVAVKWQVVKELKILDNNLVADANYYRYLNKKYYIGFYSGAHCDVKEITSEDFKLLLSKEWLTNFIIDICLNIIYTGNTMQLLTVTLATQLLNINFNNVYHGLHELLLEHKILVLPYNQNGNHFCLAVVDPFKRQFIFLNPFGSSFNETQNYLNIFKMFLLQFYTAYHPDEKIWNAQGWQIKVIDHAIQDDQYNCGVYIIYFLEKLVKQEPLDVDIDIVQYRHNLRHLLISHSDNVAQNCLFCGNSHSEKDTVKCSACNRLVHLNCLSLDGLSNGLCDLCQLY